MFLKTQITCFLVIVGAQCIICDFYRAFSYENYQWHCLTNSSSAIAVSSPFVRKENYVSSFYPKTIGTWTYDNADFVEHGWINETSMSSKVVLDRRWESFEAYYSPNSKARYDIVARDLPFHFIIPFSFIRYYDVHFFLCDGLNITTSNCLWFNLDTIRNKMIVRIASENTISINNLTSSNHVLKIMKKVQHKLSQERYSWEHYLLEKSGNHIVLKDKNDNRIIDSNDLKLQFNIKYMALYSNYESTWKIHKFNFFRTTTTTTTTFKKQLHPINGTVCISAFIKMCSSCAMKFEFKDKINNRIIKKVKYAYETSEWMEIKVIETKVKNAIALIISTEETEPSKNVFWEISNMLQCSAEGFRILKAHLLESCELQTFESPMTYNKVVESDNSKCAEDSIGSSCVPCFVFLGTRKCGKLSIYEYHNSSSLIRSNAAGYWNLIECQNKSYGHNCRQKCSQNCNNCDKSTGECDNCTDHYYGRRCDIPPTKLVIEEPPFVLYLSFTEATIRVPPNNFPKTSAFPKKYSVDYKASGDDEWKRVKTNASVDKQEDITILNLRAGTRYEVKILMDSFYNSVYDFSFNFTTRCDVPIDDDFIWDTFNTFVIIFLNKKEAYRFCFDSWNDIKIEVEPKESTINFSFGPRSAQIFGLKTSIEYEITLTNKLSKKLIVKKYLKTFAEGSLRGGLQAFNVSTSHISLKWQPGESWGELLHYILKYKILSRIGCNSENSNNFKEVLFNVTETSFNVTGLIPHTKYQIAVAAEYKDFRGPFEEIVVDTLPSGIIESRVIRFNFSSTKCSKRSGPILINICATCFEVWCKNLTCASHKHAEITLKSLEPNTNYNLKIEVCRRKFCWLITNEFIKTKPDVPYEIRNLSIYSQTENSFSLRWLPPYPPTGVIEFYNLVLRCFNKTVETNITANDFSCKSPSNYQCYTIETNVKNYQACEVQIKAKNEICNVFGPPKMIKIPTLDNVKNEGKDVKIIATVSSLVMVLIIISAILFTKFKSIRFKNRKNDLHHERKNLLEDFPFMASEFQSDFPVTVSDLCSDLSLRLQENEPNSWTSNVGKDVAKKMEKHEVKRQEHIYEFILTEKHHCINLLVLQKIFVDGLRKHFQLGPDLERMFPRLADLTELHLNLLYRLRQRQEERAVISTIADILSELFSGHNAVRLKSVYGEFCSKHREAVDTYKCYLENDARFERFIRHCETNPLLRKKEIPEWIFLVTQRLTKYPLLIESLIKANKKYKNERDILQKTLASVKDIVVEVDSQVAEKANADRQIEIYHRIDDKSYSVYQGHVFKKVDILQSNRLLKFEGVAELMHGREKVQMVLVIVLSDVLFFLQKNSDKYVFFTPDDKAGVISLQKLVVIGKAKQDSKKIYLTTSTSEETEIFELKVHKPKDKQVWISALRDAVQSCLKDDEHKSLLSAEKQQSSHSNSPILEICFNNGEVSPLADLPYSIGSNCRHQLANHTVEPLYPCKSGTCTRSCDQKQ